MSVGVIGLGYVGLPLVVAFAEAGEHVVGVDIDPRKVHAIREGESYIEDISSERLEAVLDRILPTAHYQPLARTDAVLICVPTPLTPNREPDLSAVVAATRAVARRFDAGALGSRTRPLKWTTVGRSLRSSRRRSRGSTAHRVTKAKRSR